MEKYKKIAYITLILIIFITGFFIYKVFGKNNSNDNLNEKTLEEVKQLESKFQNLFNQLNNISFENFKISSTEIEEQESQSESSSSSENSSSNNSSKEKSSEKKDNSTSKQDNKQYKLEEVGILTNQEEINWEQIKKDVEKIYTSLYSMTLDLYQTSVNQQDIVNFNKEYDNLTKAVKEENKDATLIELVKLYDYIPKFIENCTDDEKEKIVIKTKNDLFKAYSILDKENWNEISDNVNNSTQEFTKLVTNINTKEIGKQYNINKIYVIINELQNAITLKDKDIFLIKYKNLLEELQNIWYNFK
mgnify:CR=1 FL=1